MKKTLIRSCLSVALALCAQAAMAEHLYFLVGDESGDPPTYNDAPVDYSYATVKMTGADSESSYLSLYAGGATEPSGVAMMAGSTDPAYAMLPNDYANYSTFLFELWDATNDRVAWQRYSIESARSGGHIVDGTGQGTALNVTTVVPEPTGGMLMLFGMVVLAMRRKTMIV